MNDPTAHRPQGPEAVPDTVPDTRPDAVPDWLIDRLVDGELQGAAYRRCLAQLDAAPDGWRRCALAFLEAQAWQRACASAATPRPTPAATRDHPQPLPQAQPITDADSLAEADTDSAARPLVPVAPVPGRQDTPTRPRRSLAGFAWVAAGLLAAFLAGYASRQVWHGPAGEMPADPRQLAESPPDTATAPNTATDPPDIAGDGEHLVNQQQRWVDNQTPLGELTFVVNEGQPGERQVQLPVFPWNEVTHRWLAEPGASAHSSDLERQLHNLGGRVRRHHFITSVQLEDGSQLLIPVRQLEVEPSHAFY